MVERMDLLAARRILRHIVVGKANEIGGLQALPGWILIHQPTWTIFFLLHVLVNVARVYISLNQLLLVVLVLHRRATDRRIDLVVLLVQLIRLCIDI